MMNRQELEAHEAEVKKRIKHAAECMKKNISSCCEATLDESRVITSGRHKGHGPRFCSKCGRVAFMV